MTVETILSVRGEAQRTIEPDYVVLHCGIRTVAQSKAAVLDLLANRQAALTERLAALGGVALSATTIDQPITWSTHSISTNPEFDFDKGTGNHGPTGRVQALAAIAITVRVLDKAPSVEQALAGIDELSTDHVSWQVDADNPAWKEIRAEAIAAAIAKGHDYASALRGTVVRVEQIADTGLLGSDTGGHSKVAYRIAAASPEFGPSMPGLDPVPQEIMAVIEARLVAEVPPLGQ